MSAHGTHAKRTEKRNVPDRRADDVQASSTLTLSRAVLHDGKELPEDAFTGILVIAWLAELDDLRAAMRRLWLTGMHTDSAIRLARTESVRFGGHERAAYLPAQQPLPGSTSTISIDGMGNRISAARQAGSPRRDSPRRASHTAWLLTPAVLAPF
jgi:hypothetical protein